MPNPVAEVVERLREMQHDRSRSSFNNGCAECGVSSNVAGEAADLLERLSRERDTGVPEGFADQVWRLSVIAQAELDNGDDADAHATLVKIAEAARRAIRSAAPQPPTVSGQVGEVERWQHIAKHGLAKCTPEHTLQAETRPTEGRR